MPSCMVRPRWCSVEDESRTQTADGHITSILSGKPLVKMLVDPADDLTIFHSKASEPRAQVIDRLLRVAEAELEPRPSFAAGAKHEQLVR